MESREGFDSDGPNALFPLDDRAGPARRITAARASAMLDAALAADCTGSTIPSRALRGGPSRARRLVMLMVACGIAGAAWAFSSLGGRHARESNMQPAARTVRPSGAPPARAVTPAVPVATPATAPMAPIAVPAPAATLRTEPEVSAVRTARTVPSPASEPGDLLRVANEMLADHRWRDADGVYRSLRRAQRGTDAAYTATVASARLNLEHLSNPREALRLYREALDARPSGALAEGVRFGVAEAHRALNDPAAEASALRAFIAEHPDAIMRTRAQTRLQQLSGAP